MGDDWQAGSTDFTKRHILIDMEDDGDDRAGSLENDGGTQNVEAVVSCPLGHLLISGGAWGLSLLLTYNVTQLRARARRPRRALPSKSLLSEPSGHLLAPGVSIGLDRWTAKSLSELTPRRTYAAPAPAPGEPR